MYILKIFVLFYLGACLGSFTNVLVDRIQNKKSILGRSICEFCGKTLSWSENIPILGFFLVKGKCRSCKKKLSWQYPLVELSLALLFIVIGWWSGFLSAAFLPSDVVRVSFYLFLGFILFAIFLWDLKYMIVPDFLVAAGVIATFLYLFWSYLGLSCSLFDWECRLVPAVLGAIAVGGFFYLLYFFSNGKYIGGGDVKLGFLLGLVVGIKFAYMLLLFSYVLGAIFAIYLLATKKKGMKSQIPFGPFLIAGVFLVLFFGEKLLYWYKHIL